MRARAATLLTWHSKNAGARVLESTLALLALEGVQIVRVVYLVQDEATRPPLSTVPIERLRVRLRDPTSHREIHDAIKKTVLPKVADAGALHVNVSPGTPAMHAVWLVLWAGGELPEHTRLWSSQRAPDGSERLAAVDYDVTTYLKEVRAVVRARGESTYDPGEARSTARRDSLERLARFARVGGAPLLVLGERGTGKTRLVESYVSALKQRAPVVTVPCGSMDSELADSLIFGHAKGAFTGAERERKGLIAEAHGGILFLDEIQDLPRAAQRKLVRVLQDRRRRYRPLGSDREREADVDVVFASNLSLAALADRLDADLFDRIAQLVVEIPPLRECREDVETDWAHVWVEMRTAPDLPPDAPITSALRKLLGTHALPGNLRDLQRLALLTAASWQGAPGPALDRAIEEWTARTVDRARAGAPACAGTRDERIAAFARGQALDAKARHGTWEAAALALGCNERTLRRDAENGE